MINVIQTLKNLNKEFPRFQLETLLKIIECVVEKEEYTQTTTSASTIPYGPYQVWYQTDKVTCENQDCIKVDPLTCTNVADGFIHYTTTKNHTPDKTSFRQTITSEGSEAKELEDFIQYNRPSHTIFEK